MKKIIWQVKSRYALVTCINNGRGIIVEKEIDPQGNARLVNKTSVYFRKKLRENGVLIAEPYICYKKNGKAIQTSPYVGLDLEKIFHQGGANEKLLTKLIGSISGILNQEVPEVGIDARLSNFCLGPNEDIYYVDTFPPLVKYKGEYLVHFPNPTDGEILKQEFFRKFDCFGILRRLRFSILEQDVGFTEDHIINAINDVLGSEFAKKTKDFFETFPDHTGTLDLAFSMLKIKDTDGIRELALRLMPHPGKNRESFLNDIFELSSNFCPIKLSPDERLTRIKRIFLDQL